MRSIIATILQAAGVLCVAGGVAMISLWGGLVTLGIGTILFGLAAESSNSQE